jgi:hypothetical protein
VASPGEALSAHVPGVGSGASPDPLGAGTTPAGIAARGPIGIRVAQLRELAERDPERAQNETWEWFIALGGARDEESLDELFTLGVAKPMEGSTDGILAAFLVTPALDNLVMAFCGPGRFTMPWKGKVFEPDTQDGANRFKFWFPFIARLVWPRYRGHRRDGREHLLFDMTNGVIRDPLDPSHEVWKIEYKDKDLRNPFFIRDILDCLVEIVPGAHLGRIEYEGKYGFRNLGYFALKPAT